jgi:hypothetical protein
MRVSGEEAACKEKKSECNAISRLGKNEMTHDLFTRGAIEDVSRSRKDVAKAVIRMTEKDTTSCREALRIQKQQEAGNTRRLLMSPLSCNILLLLLFSSPLMRSRSQ